jgi:DNA-binding LytR/AlgR family response regulator
MEKLNILIVEDDPIIGADLQDRLGEMGYHTLGPVAAGEDAPGFFSGPVVPDLVIMDVQLEGQWDGIETTRRIREKNNPPIIFLTSNSDEATFRQASEVNPQAFLSKPFRGRDLKHAIELAIRQAAAKKGSTAPPEDDNAFLFNDRLFIKSKERMVRLFFKDILWVEADDYYCKVVTRGKEYLVTQTLGKFSEAFEKLPSFMRAHRSFLINLEHVEEIGELYLQIASKQIPYSKNMKDELMKKLMRQ